MPSADGFMSSFKARHATKPKRTNWKLEVKKERCRVIGEAIQLMRDELRKESMPEAFKRGHYAAITKLEIMKDEVN